MESVRYKAAGCRWRSKSLPNAEKDSLLIRAVLRGPKEALTSTLATAETLLQG